MAECELLTAEKAAESRMTQLAERARNRHDFCVATRLRLTLYTTLDRSDRCAEVFVDWLRRDGTMSNQPVRFAVELGYDVTLVKDATADYSEEFMHAALVTNLPNYASAIVTTQEFTDALSGSRPLEQSSYAMGAPHG